MPKKTNTIIMDTTTISLARALGWLKVSTNLLYRVISISIFLSPASLDEKSLSFKLSSFVLIIMTELILFLFPRIFTLCRQIIGFDTTLQMLHKILIFVHAVRCLFNSIETEFVRHWRIAKIHGFHSSDLL